jgi:hypothetical protein
VTTLTTLQTGKAAVQWVACIEGYEYLLTDGDTSAAVTAWAATDWTQALGGLVVQGDWSQKLDPWNPFSGGGSVTLHIQPDSLDLFGIVVHKTAVDADSELTVAIDTNDTTLTVKDSGQFSAAPGTVFIGTERISYSAKPTSTTLTASVRGKYAPFSTNSGTANQFGRAHRIGITSNRVNVPPVVSQDPRSWIGRWVGLWMHAKAGSVLDAKSDAVLSFAGRIVEVRDSPDTGGTVLELESVLDVVGNTAIGKDFFRATVADGVYITSGFNTFDMDDWDGTTGRTANTHTIAAGYYSVEEIASDLTTWLLAEKAAARIAGYYSVVSPCQNAEGDWKTRIEFRITAVGTIGRFSLKMPKVVADALGYTLVNQIGNQVEVFVIIDGGNRAHYSQQPPLKKTMNGGGALGAGQTIYLENEQGTVVDQTSTLPNGMHGRTAFDSTLPWGLFACNGHTFLAAYSTGQLNYVASVSPTGALAPISDATTVRYGEDDSGFSVRQIYAVEGSLSDLLPRLLCSTGTAAYNHATYDTLPAEISAGIPFELLGTTFTDSCQSLDAGSADLLLMIDKPTTLADLLGADLILRGASIGWKTGKLRMVQWQNPNGSTAVYALTEANKASASGIEDIGRTSVALSTQHMRNSVKIEYCRPLDSDTYAKTFILEDIGSVDDQGGASKALTISMRNSTSELDSTSIGVESAVPGFLSRLPLFSRPMRLLKRSIGFDLFESISTGDVVTVADNFARDPATGVRGLAKQGLIVGMRYDWGGPNPGRTGKARDVFGEVEIMLLDADRTALYAPACHIDSTHTTGGFTAGYDNAAKQLYMLTNANTDSVVDVVHDASFFSAGDLVTIIEIDPAVAASPTRWDRTISTVVGDVVTLTAALSAPAFDTAKQYRMVSQLYTSATTTQRTKTYLADDVDGRILNTSPPFVLGVTQRNFSISETYANLAERHSAETYDEGRPLDASTERALIRTCNHLVGNFTKTNTPLVYESAFTGATVTGTDWQCISYAPIFLGPQLNAAGTFRKLRCAVQFKSSTGGQTAKMRLTLSRFAPQSSSTATPFVNMLMVKPASQSAAITTTSTTYVVSADVDLDVSVVSASGEAWLIVEVQQYANTYGVIKAYATRVA